MADLWQTWAEFDRDTERAACPCCDFDNGAPHNHALPESGGFGSAVDR